MAGKGGRRSTTWKKGQGGRRPMPKEQRELRDLCRELTAEAVKVWTAAIRNPKARLSDRLAAANSIVDRGWGKPTQHVEASVSILDKLSDVEQRSLAAALEALAGEPSDAAGGTTPTHH